MYYIVTTTSDNNSIPKNIASKILEMNLSPCVQIIPNIKSYYKWNNKIEFSNEYIINIKTIKTNIDIIKNIIKDNHNYDVPEIISYKFKSHNKDYNKWFSNNIKENNK